MANEYKAEEEIITGDFKKINALSAVLLIIIFSFAFFISYLINGDISSAFAPRHFNLVIFLAVFFSGTVVHELTHGIIFLIMGVPYDKIKFGFKWKYLMPYAHCKAVIKVSVLRIDYLLPFIFPGLMLLFSGIILKIPSITYAGIGLCSGSMGDFAGIWLTRNLNPDTLILDHPDKVGFRVIKNENN